MEDAAPDSLAAALRLPGAHSISPEKVAALLDLSTQDLATYAGVSVSSLRSYPQSPRARAFMDDAVRVMTMAIDISGDIDRARHLLKTSPIPSLDGKTALQLVRERRTEDVTGYLRSVSSGFVG